MLEVRDQEHLDRVKAFAEERGLLEQLEKQLEYLTTWGGHGRKTKCELIPDIGGGVSFTFSVYGQNRDTGLLDRFIFNGGLTYHGPEDGFGSGSGPSFAVCLEPTHGWAIHT